MVLSSSRRCYTREEVRCTAHASTDRFKRDSGGLSGPMRCLGLTQLQQLLYATVEITLMMLYLRKEPVQYKKRHREFYVARWEALNGVLRQRLSNSRHQSQKSLLVIDTEETRLNIERRVESRFLRQRGTSNYTSCGYRAPGGVCSRVHDINIVAQKKLDSILWPAPRVLFIV